MHEFMPLKTGQRRRQPTITGIQTVIHELILPSMARSTPPQNINVASFHPALPSSSSSLSWSPLLAAWCISVTVLFLALCGSSSLKSWMAKKPKRRLLLPSSPARPASGSNAVDVGPREAEETVKDRAKFSSEIGSVESSVVCGAATHGPIAPSFPARPPKPRLSMSLIMKLPRKLSKIRIRTRRKEKKERSAPEDSVWMKTIILGERCNVPSGDEEENVAFYGDDGNRRRNYRPRTPTSLPVSPRLHIGSVALLTCPLMLE